jgi:sulfite reductase alpha subunit-like flavoprotein
VHAVVIYESLTGNTRKVAEMTAARLSAQGVPTVACPITAVDYQALARADLVVVGSWVDGFFVVGQRPGRRSRIAAMPTLAGKRAVVYLTYALDPGKALEKLAAAVEARGADVLGGITIRRDRIDDGVEDFVDRILGAVAAA